MIIATETQDRTVRALAVIAGRELQVTVYQVTSYSNPNTWGMWFEDLETGEQGFADFPKGEDWTAPRYYNVLLKDSIGHPRSLEDAVIMAYSEASIRR